eukprot:1092599-Amphidinium_carterae.1
MARCSSEEGCLGVKHFVTHRSRRAHKESLVHKPLWRKTCCVYCVHYRDCKRGWVESESC